jgi:sugar phosphate isomerase/epimerase
MGSSVHQAFSVLEGRIRSTHIHDNKRDKDSHLWPGDGTIDWEQTMQSLRTMASGAPAMLLEIEGTEDTDVPGKMAECYEKLESAGVTAE